MLRPGWLCLPALLALASVSLPASANRLMVQGYGELPLSFEANRGQSDPQVKFLARGRGYALFLTPAEIVMSLAQPGGRAAVRIRLLGSRGARSVDGLEQLPGRSNYLTGREPSQWRRGIPNYARVRYREVYPGIDLVFYGNQRQLEYDFVVASGADPGLIRLAFEGAGSLRVDGDGDLVLKTGAGEIRQHKPFLFQEDGGVRQPVSGRYLLEGTEVAFRVGNYDRRRALRIDPVLSYSSFLGGDGAVSGGNDYGRGIAVDGAGNVYIAGTTESPQFPVTNAGYQKTYGGGTSDAFVVKLDSSGATRLYATYLGTAAQDEASGIAVDAAGNAYITGFTSSNKFPVTPGAAQTAYGGSQEAFAVKLDPTGTTLVYSTFIGGSSSDYGRAIAVDGAGNACVAGSTISPNFPVTAGAYQSPVRPVRDVFLTKIDPGGTAFVYSAVFGGSGDEEPRAVAVDASGQAHVAGYTWSTDFPVTSGALRTSVAVNDGFVVKLNAAGTAPVYSTLVGGGGNDDARGIALDSAGNAYVTGLTSSNDLPVTKAVRTSSYGGGPLDPIRYLFDIWSALRRQRRTGGLDAFLIKLNDSGTTVLHGSYLGGTGNSTGNAIAVEAVTGDVFIAGETNAPDFPVTPGAVQHGFGGGNFDAFVVRLKASDLSYRYSTFLGGADEDRAFGLAVDSSGAAHITGQTISGNFPTTPGALQTRLNAGGFDAFAARLDGGGVSLKFSTYLGGSGGSANEEARDIAIDSQGNAYVTGTTYSTDFPASSAALQPTPGGLSDAFVVKVDASGGNLVYATYLGGKGEDNGNGIAVDATGSVYVTGWTGSQDFPVTAGAYRTSIRSWDGFVAKLNATGSDLIYATFIGGGSNDSGMRVAVDLSGNAYVAGFTKSADFPTTSGAAQRTFGGGDRDGFALKLSPDGKNLLFATCLGGNLAEDVFGIALHESGTVYVSGTTSSTNFPTTSGALQTRAAGVSTNGFVAKLDGTSGAFVYSTLLGATDTTDLTGVAVDSAGNAYVTGSTTSSTFPTTPGAYNTRTVGRSSFAAKLNPEGSGLVYSTFLFLGAAETGYDIAIDAAGNAYVAGITGTPGLPVGDDSLQVGLSGATDGFLAKLDPEGKSVPYVTYLGGTGNERIAAVRADASGNVYVTGYTSSSGFPATTGAFQRTLGGPRNGFVAKFDFNQTVPVVRPKIEKIVNYASEKPEVAPGTIITIIGDRLATASASAGAPLETRSTQLPGALGGARVAIPARVVQLFSVSPEQIVAQLPYAAQVNQPTYVTVTVEGVSSAAYRVDVLPAAIGVLALYKPDMTPLSAGNKVRSGDPFVAYVTGFGPANIPSGVPALPDSIISPDKPVEAWTAMPGQSFGESAQIESYTLVPGLVGVARATIRSRRDACPDSGQLDFWMTASGEAPSNKVRFYCLPN